MTMIAIQKETYIFLVFLFLVLFVSFRPLELLACLLSLAIKGSEKTIIFEINSLKIIEEQINTYENWNNLRNKRVRKSVERFSVCCYSKKTRT